MMQALGRRYVRHINRTYRRTGTLWEGRYRATAIDSEAYLLACQRYIEQNPARARMVADAVAYRWSSHAADALVRPHPLYLALGATATARQAAYRALFAVALDDGFIAELRAPPARPPQARYGRARAGYSRLTPFLPIGEVRLR